MNIKYGTHNISVLSRLTIIAFLLNYFPGKIIKLIPRAFLEHNGNKDALYRLNIHKESITAEWLAEQFEFSIELIQKLSNSVVYVRDSECEAIAARQGSQPIIAINPSFSSLLRVDKTVAKDNFEIWTQDITLFEKYIKEGWQTNLICEETFKESKISNNHRLTYTVSEHVVHCDSAREFPLVHYLGPVGFCVLVLVQAGASSEIFGWNQYLNDSMKNLRFFKRLRLSTGRSALHNFVDKWNFFGELGFSLDHRHVQRNLTNLWLMKEIKMKHQRIKVHGAITWACENAEIFKRWPVIVGTE